MFGGAPVSVAGLVRVWGGAAMALLWLSGQPASAQPSLPATKPLSGKPLYAILSSTVAGSNGSASGAAKAADRKLQDWVRRGWVPISIAAVYSDKETGTEGREVTTSRAWAVHVLLTCTPVLTGKKPVTCLRPGAAPGPAPHP